ncbi:MAG: peptidase M15 [Bacteroidales bacterium]|nr:peptidase M15 [Bacteroidales bacterium]
MKYFTIQELCKSKTATDLGIDNIPKKSHEANMKLLIENLLDPIREMWGNKIYVNSGYRCKELNDAVGGVETSSHIYGQAADISVRSVSGNKELFEMIKNSDLKWTQLISEKTTNKGCKWIHISYCENNLKNQVLYLR